MTHSLTRHLAIIIFGCIIAIQLPAQNVGIGEQNPGSKLSIKGNMSLGLDYSTTTAPTGGLIIEGQLGVGTLAPDSNAVIDITSTSKGIMLPRLTHQQILNIHNPTKGLMVFDTDSNYVYHHTGKAWVNLTPMSQVNTLINNAIGSLSLGGSGSTWYTGSGVPGVAIGNLSDMYLNASNGNYYQKTSAVLWTLKGNLTGATGATGSTGAGTTGATGPTGTNGNNGSAGATGAAGTNGTNGATGPTGANGAVGATGPTGATGANGSNGAAGATGSTGTTGSTGAAGTNGSNGVTGPTGAQGTAGVNGIYGTNGANGTTGAGYTATSTTSVTMGTGGKTFTTQSGLAYLANARVRISNTATNYLEGSVSSYSGTSLVVNIDYVAGSGTYASWNISIAGNIGSAGATGATGAAGTNGSAGVTGVTGPSGSTGANGNAGSIGATGPTGTAGAGFSGSLSNGQVMFGSSSNTVSQSNSFFWDNNNGRLGIGTSSPTQTFSVGSGSQFTVDNSGNVVLSSSSSLTMSSLMNGQIIFPNSSGKFTQSNSLFWDNNNTRLGIGTSSPTQTFSVGSASQFTSDNSGNVLIASSGSLTMSGLYNGQLIFPNSSGKFTQSNSLFWDNGNIRLGIGTSSPTQTFSVGSASQFTVDNSGDISVSSSGSLTMASLTTGQLLFPINGKFTQSNSLFWDNNNIRLGIGTSSPTQTFSVGSGSQFTADNAGNVSIASSGSFTMASLTTGQILFPVNGKFTQNNSLFWDNGNNRLGVGTSSPTQALSVGSASQFTVDNSGNIAVSNSGSITVASLTTGQLLFPNSSGKFTQSNNLFWDNGNARLGVGNSSPQYLLDVSGQARITGNLIIGAITLPNTDGASNQVLTTNGSGTVSWQNASSSSSGWSLTGNSGTTPGTNFIGTIDNQSLVFKANNQQAGKIDLIFNNAIFGYQAGNTITSGGTNSTFIGYQAGYSNTSGPSNTAIGSIALFANTTGSGNAALGMGALGNNTTGSNNTAVGTSALRYNTTSASNVAVGASALFQNTTGNYNTSIGAYSMQNNTTGASNVATGYSALSANKTGTGNTATGSGSLQGNTSGINNTAFGNGSLQIDSTGNGNVGLGAFALQYATNASYNVGIGYGSLLALTTASYNTAIGNSSGATITTGSYNTFIGDGADATSGSLTNATALGYNAKVAASNSLILGGTGSYTVNVGIGTTTPLSTLDINGGMAVGTYAGLNAAGSGNIIVSGNIGVGTATPGNKVTINSGTGGASGLRLQQLPSGAVLFMSSTSDVAQNNQNFYFDATNYRLGICAGTAPNSTLQINGALSTGVSTKTASYTMGASDYTILCNNTSGSIALTLPLASGATGRIYVVKKISALGTNPVLVQRNGSGSDLIDGAASVTINNQYASIILQSDGTNWWILSAQ